MIGEKFGRVPGARTICRYHSKIDSSFKKTRPILHRSAFEKEQEKSKKVIQTKLLKYIPTHMIFFKGEAGVRIGARSGRAWRTEFAIQSGSDLAKNSATSQGPWGRAGSSFTQRVALATGSSSNFQKCRTKSTVCPY